MKRIKTKHILLMQCKERNIIKKLYNKNMNYIKQNKLDTIDEHKITLNENKLDTIDEWKMFKTSVIVLEYKYNHFYNEINKSWCDLIHKFHNKGENFKKPKDYKKNSYKFKNMNKRPMNKKMH